MPASHTRSGISWLAQLVAAGILGYAAIAKLVGAAGPVALFTLLGVEPWGRILIGCGELAAAVMLLVPRTALFGGLLAIARNAGCDRHASV